MNGIFTSIVMIVGGILLIVKGAGYLIDGSTSIARRFGMKPIFIGLTIVAFGTSMPELVVNLYAVAQDQAGLAVGNILGSNISNILLILGISAAMVTLPVKPSTVSKEIPFALLSVLVLLIMVWDGVLDRADGLVLLAFFIIFMYYTFGIGRVEGQAEEFEKMPLRKSVAFIAAGIIGLAVGGHLTVGGAEGVAVTFGISQEIIGLTIVAIGSSLPELAASVVAARRKEVDLAIGNIVGSNIFNILWVFGLSATIRNIAFAPPPNFDVIMVIAATLILLSAMYIGRRNVLQRREGYLFLIIYGAYLAYLVAQHVAST